MNRRRALVGLGVLASACGRRSETQPMPPRVRELLAVGREFGEHDAAAEADAASELLRIAARVSAVRKGDLASALNDAVFGTFGFVREVTDTDLSYVLLPSVLRVRRGSCVGLGSLYLALSELLSVSASGVLLPGHFFVRLGEGGRTRNVELLRRGEELPESWYRERYPIAGGAAPAYGRALTGSEVLGVVEFDVGNQRKREGRLQDARRAYQRATLHFPDFAEAHASLGAVQHVLGQLDAAARAYRSAEQKYPSLPGLGSNIALLERERAGRLGADALP